MLLGWAGLGFSLLSSLLFFFFFQFSPLLFSSLFSPLSSHRVGVSPLGASWVGLGRSWDFLGVSLGVLGPLLGRSWESAGSLLGGLGRS